MVIYIIYIYIYIYIIQWHLMWISSVVCKLFSAPAFKIVICKKLEFPKNVTPNSQIIRAGFGGGPSGLYKFEFKKKFNLTFLIFQIVFISLEHLWIFVFDLKIEFSFLVNFLKTKSFCIYLKQYFLYIFVCDSVCIYCRANDSEDSDNTPINRVRASGPQHSKGS